MTEIKTVGRADELAYREYRELPPADKAVFKTLIDLAVILLKQQYTEPNATTPKKGE